MTDAQLLDTLPLQQTGDLQVIIEPSAFLTVCPVTGLEDAAQLRITYQPDAQIVELASLASYLATFRTRRISQEDAVSTILADLVEALHPRSMTVESTDHHIQGAIKQRCFATHWNGDTE